METAELLMNEFSELQFRVQRCGSGALVHKLNNLLQTALGYAEFKEKEKFYEYKTKINQVLFGQSINEDKDNTPTTIRKYFRKSTKLPVTITIGETIIDGTILDSSPDGYFIKPVNSYSNGEFIHEDDVLDLLDSNEDIKVNVTVNKNTTTVKANIRWTGYSKTHGCFGFGCQLK